jgi:hypothetical protein
MKYCKKCGVSVNTRYDFCPLCAAGLTGEEDSEIDAAVDEMPAVSDDLYPAGSDTVKYNLTLRILLFITVVGVLTCVLINILAYQGMLWSLLVAAGAVFIWAAAGYPFIAHKNIGYHITVDAVCACIFFIVAQVVTNTKGWSLDYVVPFLFIAATTIISFVLLIKRMKWREYVVYQFIAIFLGLLPVISVIAGLVDILWPSIVSAFYSFITLLGMFVFADKKYKNELIKRFHF